MTFKSLLAAGLLLTLAACALPPAGPAAPGPTEPTSAMLGELARVDGLTPAQRRREIADLEGLRRLDGAHRFQLGALLAHEDSAESLERSAQVLNALAAADARTQALLDLMRQSLRTRLDLIAQTARTQELQDKLTQIKALEKSLQQRNGLPKAP